MFGRGADEAEIKFNDFKPVVFFGMTGLLRLTLVLLHRHYLFSVAYCM